MLYDALLPPSLQRPFGTDNLGRCILSRIIYGGRIVIYTFVISTIIAGSLGITLGLMSGYFGGIIDHLVMRIMDILLAFPSIILALAIVGTLGVGLQNALLAVGISQIAPYSILVRGQVLPEKELSYVEDAKAIGASHVSIMFRHILPNIVGPIIVHSTFVMAGSLLRVAALSYFGVGAQPPAPDWGLMIYENSMYLRMAPHAIFFPGLCIFLVAFAFNKLGETIRDVFDPQLRKEFLGR
jgi:peptide/nickel transport system permease protein